MGWAYYKYTSSNLASLTVENAAQIIIDGINDNGSSDFQNILNSSTSFNVYTDIGMVIDGNDLYIAVKIQNSSTPLTST